MLTTPKMKEIYEKIQSKLFEMIPEKWDRVYLYASIIDRLKELETGEMFFYYYPKSLFKKNPINVYEVPSKFNVEEKAYLKLADKLYDQIKELREECRNNNDKLWSNLTISIENCQFKVEYHYEDLLSSRYSSYDRHIIWRYIHLAMPITSFNKQEAKIIETYLSSLEYIKLRSSTYTQGMYKKKKPNNHKIEYKVERSINKDKVNTTIEGEFKKPVRNQILQVLNE